VKLSLVISHTPWIRARVQSMARLRELLGVPGAIAQVTGNEAIPGTPLVAYREETERAPNWIWSFTSWAWSAETDADICLFLQDDLVVAPNFWPALQAMLSPGVNLPAGRGPGQEIVSLATVHPAAKRVARDGGRWFTTIDGLVGLGYAIPRLAVREFLEWRKGALFPDALQWITEDSLLNIWALCTKRRIWHPVPTIIDHDVELRSTYSNDEHLYRSPSVTWADGDVCGWRGDELNSPSFWSADKPVPHFGRMYKQTHIAAKKLVRGFTQAQYDAAERDRCPQPYARFFTYP
jgi:hypothetical protein